jgi:hypothetical protein
MSQYGRRPHRGGPPFSFSSRDLMREPAGQSIDWGMPQDYGA